MDNSNNAPYGHPSGGAPYYPPPHGQYPATHGSYPAPVPPPPGPGQQGYHYPNTSLLGTYPAYGQQPGPGYQGQQPTGSSYQNPGQGHPPYGPTSPAPATFEPGVPQYAQQLSPPQTYGHQPPSPGPSYGYNPQNPPPLPPRSPAAQYSFAPPPVTAISSKPAGTLGRFGAKVAGTVQSKVKDYLAAKQWSVQGTTSNPGTPGAIPTTPVSQPYGYSHSSQPWQGQTGGAQSYSTPTQSSTNVPSSTYHHASNSYSQPNTNPHSPSQGNSAATPQGHPVQESAPAAAVGIYGQQPTANSPPAVTGTFPAPPPPGVCSPAPVQTPTTTPVPTPAPTITSGPIPVSPSIAAATPASTQSPQVKQTLSPELPVNSQSVFPPASVTQPPTATSGTTQAPEQRTQATTPPTESSMTWGWNLSLNPASQPLGEAMPQLKLTPMFKNSTASQAQPTATGPDTSGQGSPPPSISPPSTAAHEPISQVPPVPEKKPLQAVSPKPESSSSPPVVESQPESGGFQPYRPYTAANNLGIVGVPDAKPTSAAPIQAPTPKPLNITPVAGIPTSKPKPEAQKFRPYRAPSSDQAGDGYPSQKGSLPANSQAQEPPSNPTAAGNADPWCSPTSSFSASSYGSRPTQTTTSSHTQPATLEHPASLSPGRLSTQEHPPSLSPGPSPPQNPPSRQEGQQRSDSMNNSLTALGDLITDELQNMSILNPEPKTNQPDYSIPSAHTPRDTSETTTNIPSQFGEPREHYQPASHVVAGSRQGPPYTHEYCPYPMLTSPMHSKAISASSTPHQSRLCFEFMPAPFPRFYYRHPGALSFPICSWCFNTYIAPTNLASAFPESLGVVASGVVCGFHVPRITKSLWPGALKSGDLTDLVKFMEKRYPTLPTATGVPKDAHNNEKHGADANPNTSEVALIKPCKPQGGIVFQSERYRWYAGTDSLRLLVCEACFEDFILAAPSFAEKFGGPWTQAEVNQHTLHCQLSAFPYIKRALLRYGGPVGNWEGFSRDATMRLEMSKASKPISCGGMKMMVSNSRWRTLKGDGEIIGSLPLESDDSIYGRLQATDHFVICETCYMDAVAGSRFEEAFEIVTEVVSNAWDNMDRYMIYRWCTYSSGKNHAIQDAFSAAEMRKLSPQTLHSMLKEIASKPRCGQVPMGIQDGLFYNFPAADHVDQFGICEGHFISTVKAWDLDRWFGESPRLIPGQAYCAFHPAIPRADQWIHKINEALDTGDMSIYKENVRKFAAIPFCPRRDAVANRNWYGWPDCLICPDCFEQFAAGTKLVKEMSWNNEHADYLAICSMYSPRQRELYNKACESGDVRELLAVSAERTKIWNKTVPRMTTLAARKVIAEGEAMLASQLAHTHATSNAISLGDDGTRWTTSSGNTYQSYDGVLAEKYRNEADQLYAKVRGMDATSERIYLMQLWESVE